MEVIETIVAVKWWMDMGFMPIPTSMDRHPRCSWSSFRTSPPPAYWHLSDLWRNSMIQLMCGINVKSARKLMVLDLDGQAACGVWAKKAGSRGWPTIGSTWASGTPSGGVHLYFLIEGETGPIRSGPLWLGIGKHQEIRRLGDGALATAPPSCRDDGKRYAWLEGSGPGDIPLPATAPQDVLSAPVVSMKPTLVPRSVGKGSSAKWVLKVDPYELAERLGIHICGRVRQGGWVNCRAYDRDDGRPSANYNVETGSYVDFATGRRSNAVEIAVERGLYRAHSDARRELYKEAE